MIGLDRDAIVEKWNRLMNPVSAWAIECVRLASREGHTRQTWCADSVRLGNRDIEDSGS
jgi:hypothetical protein